MTLKSVICERSYSLSRTTNNLPTTTDNNMDKIPTDHSWKNADKYYLPTTGKKFVAHRKYRQMPITDKYVSVLRRWHNGCMVLSELYAKK